MRNKKPRLPMPSAAAYDGRLWTKSIFTFNNSVGADILSFAIVVCEK
jgi:hypothetical protein